MHDDTNTRDDRQPNAVDEQGFYDSGRCPVPDCLAAGLASACICESCGANGCDECIIDDGAGYICDECRTAETCIVQVEPDRPCEGCDDAEGFTCCALARGDS